VGDYSRIKFANAISQKNKDSDANYKELHLDIANTQKVKIIMNMKENIIAFRFLWFWSADDEAEEPVSVNLVLTRHWNMGEKKCEKGMKSKTKDSTGNQEVLGQWNICCHGGDRELLNRESSAVVFLRGLVSVSFFTFGGLFLEYFIAFCRVICIVNSLFNSKIHCKFRQCPLFEMHNPNYIIPVTSFPTI